MYAAGDPRATLATAPRKASPEAFKEAQYARFYESEPQDIADGGRTWYARGQNLVVAYTDGKPGLTLERDEQPDEYMIVLPDTATEIEVTASGSKTIAKGDSVIVVPSGKSSVRLLSGGVIVRLFTTQSADMAEKCANAEAYATPDPNVAPYQPWPAAPDGERVRVYGLDIPDEPGRFGRIFRCSTIMVNCIRPSAPRDTTRMSPHSHDDFEQYSLCLGGSYIHHLRWPWISNMAEWRADEAEQCDAPSVAVIPPQVIHTSRGVDPKGNLLVDIFCPPRADFSAKPGWVLNADEYPAPAETTRQS